MACGQTCLGNAGGFSAFAKSAAVLLARVLWKHLREQWPSEPICAMPPGLAVTHSQNDLLFWDVYSFYSVGTGSQGPS
jgi:hypothetical protein